MNEYVATRVVSKSRAVVLKDLPYEEGTVIEIVISEIADKAPKRGMTVKDLLESGLVGMWADRDDIGDTLEYARKLREEASKPRVTIHDLD